MSVGPLAGLIPSAAGAPLAQTKGPEVERAQHVAAVSENQVQGQQKAETAAGIGQPDGEDHQTDQRDADGRLPWQRPAHRDDADEKQDEGSPPPPKDPTGQSGSLLDLAG